MHIKIKKIHIENFKGVKSLDVSFGDKTKIKGQNASGKTTVFDAFTWLLFNKNSAGDEKFNVRPLDVDGNRIDNVEIRVVAVLEVDGREVELSKVQKQNWVKKRGTDTAVLQGNVNSFEVDGYPKSEAEYKAYIASLVDEDLFKMLTNPQYFAGVKWKDQRNILMRLVSDVLDVEIAKKDPQFAELVPELEKAPSTDDIGKKYSKALSEWKKKQAEIPVRIDELSKSIVDIDVAEQELAKTDLERQIAEIDEKVADSGKAVDALLSESMQLQFDINGMYTAANDELTRNRREMIRQMDEAETEFNQAHESVATCERKSTENKISIEENEKERKRLSSMYKEENAKTFDETPYRFDETKWVFDESSTVCSLCGQKLPEDKIAELKVDFAEKKSKAKQLAENELAEKITFFYANKESTLNKIKEDGFKVKKAVDDATAENADLQKKVEELKAQEVATMAKKNEISKQLSDMPEKPDMSGNKEYLEKKSRYEELEKQIANLKDSTSAVDTYKQERKALVEELDKVKAEIAKAAKNVEIEERIGELEEEQKEVGQKVADQEKMLYLLEQFIRYKMESISENINSKFKAVSWKLFDIQLNGGVKECCECTVNGVPYSTLNSGHRIIAGLDIIDSLGELYGVTAPIFIDNAESLNEFNVPDMAAQMVLLAVSEDKVLTVSENF